MKQIAFLILFFLFVSVTCAQQNLGTIDFPATGKEAAQPHFLRGVLLLHSFEYPDAREAFEEAIKLDPDFVMAYWGAAMTHTHPIWMEQNLQDARAILNKLDPSLEERQKKATTAREKAWLATVEVLYGEGTKEERDLKYEKAMAELANAYSNDLEASVFHALSVLGTAHQGRDFRIYMKAAGILEEAYQKAPNHPGILHYMIHCYDDPVHATLGLRPARKYAKVAGAAAHAQHMPSHIFLALGLWDDVVSSNDVSWKVADERVNTKKLGLEERGYHYLYWLQYGYLQQGRYNDARKTLAIMEEDAKKSPTSRILWHLIRMRAAQIIETGQWDGDAIAITADASKVRPAVAAVHFFASGYAALKRKDISEARKNLVELQGLIKKSSEDAGESHHGMAAPRNYPLDPKTLEIMTEELDAGILFAEGKREEAIEKMKKAASVESALTFEFGPPEIVKPSHELLGEMLLEMKKAPEAQISFEQALERAP
ncbi:tetratricopeptide repeat protein, partial [bacterium]|nr:tetratricopeptide repeat protein [bacterium]